MLKTLLSTLEAAFKVWGYKEKNKYVDKLVSLKTAFRHEDSKPADQRDNAVLDNIEYELRVLADSFAAEVARQNA